jgi:hypothetical protein
LKESSDLKESSLIIPEIYEIAARRIWDCLIVHTDHTVGEIKIDKIQLRIFPFRVIFSMMRPDDTRKSCDTFNCSQSEIYYRISIHWKCPLISALWEFGISYGQIITQSARSLPDRFLRYFVKSDRSVDFCGWVHKRSPSFLHFS